VRDSRTPVGFTGASGSADGAGVRETVRGALGRTGAGDSGAAGSGGAAASPGASGASGAAGSGGVAAGVRATDRGAVGAASAGGVLAGVRATDGRAGAPVAGGDSAGVRATDGRAGAPDGFAGAGGAPADPAGAGSAGVRATDGGPADFAGARGAGSAGGEDDVSAAALAGRGAAGVRETFTGPAGASTSGSAVASASSGTPCAGPSRIFAARETSNAPRARRRASLRSFAVSGSGSRSACDIGVKPLTAEPASPNRNSDAKSLSSGTCGRAGAPAAGSRATPSPAPSVRNGGTGYDGASGADASAGAGSGGGAWCVSRVDAARCFGARAAVTWRARCAPPRWPWRPFTRSAIRTGGSPIRAVEAPRPEPGPGVCGASSLISQKS
jgi:hypothetical protein